jgi:hypothetical protein
MDVKPYASVVRPMLAKLLLLLAVLLMPLGMTPAAAVDHNAHAAAAMPMGHCDKQAPDQRTKHGIGECTMACSAALPAADFASDPPLLIACTPLCPSGAAMLDGLHPDTATPPPRNS